MCVWLNFFCNVSFHFLWWILKKRRLLTIDASYSIRLQEKWILEKCQLLIHIKENIGGDLATYVDESEERALNNENTYFGANAYWIGLEGDNEVNYKK